MLETAAQVSDEIPKKPATKSKYRISILMGILIVCALLIRMYNGDAPFLTPLGLRSYDSAVIAQAMYLLSKPSTPDDIRRVAQTNLKQAHVMEPRVVERLAVFGYRIFGVCIWWPRLFLSFFWCISAIPIFMLVSRLYSPSAGIVSVCFYLLSPFAIFSSRLFQPDSLMIGLMGVSLYCLWNEFQSPTRMTLWLAILTTALAMFVKIPSAFLLMSALAALSLDRYGLKGSLLNPRVWLLVAGVSLPSLWYYGSGLFVSGALRYQMDIQWQPTMYLHLDYWLGWGKLIAKTNGIPAALLAGIGLYFFRLRPARSMILGLWIGYLVYGLIFTKGVSTHLYYHMPLTLIIAISLGPTMLALGCRWMRLSIFIRYGFGFLVFILVGGAITIAVSSSDSSVKRFISPQVRGWMESGLNLCGANTPGIYQWKSRYGETTRVAAHIGQVLHHSNRVVLLGGAKVPIMKYHGLISTYVWWDYKRVQMLEMGIDLPPIEEEFPQRFQSIVPEYFLAWPEERLQYQPDLLQYLERRYPVLERRDGYVIYDLRSVPDAKSIP